MSTLNEQTKKDLSALRILVAEGDQINLAVLRHLLKKGGCTFDLATSKSEILEKHKGKKYDLLLLDLDSKDLESHQTVIKIRSDEQNNSTRLIILGLSNNINPTQFIEAGVDHYLLRPVKWADLVEYVDLLTQPKQNDTKEQPAINLDNLFTSFGSAEMVTNILKLFMAQTPDNMKLLDEFVIRQDWNAFGMLSHNMKSVYALIGLPIVKNYFDEMERDCNAKTVDVEKFKNYLATIKEVNSKAMIEMEKTLLASTR